MVSKAKTASALKTVFNPTRINLAFSKSIVKSLDDLSQKRQLWEETDYKKSFDGLCDLLAESKDIFDSKFIKGSDDDRRTLRMELTTRLKADNIKVQRNTTTLTMFIRFIFRSDRKRAHAYQYVLKAAISHGIPSSKLAQWITAQGGIEEVKRKMIISEEALKRKTDREQAFVQVQSSAELAVNKPLAFFKVKQPMKFGEYSLMVGKPHEDGLVNVIAILGDAPHKLVKTVYQRIGNQLLSINQESASIESEMKGLKSKVEPSNDSFNQNKAA